MFTADRSFAIALIVLTVCLLTASVQTANAASDCEPHWAAERFCELGVRRGLQAATVNAAVVWDDGTGPALYVAGQFTTAGCVEDIRHIAKWDGIKWSELRGPSGGAGIAGNMSRINALVVFDDGSGPALYVGGSFTSAGGEFASNIARWDGTNWSTVGPSGLSGEIYALSPSPSGLSLVAGGMFSGSFNNIASWDGSEWSPFISAGGAIGIGGAVFALHLHDDGAGLALYAGGSFVTASGGPVNRVAKWTGSNWAPLVGSMGTGVENTVFSFGTHDDGSGPALYVGGLFPTAGGVTVNGIARWQDDEWSALVGPSGTGVVTSVRAIQSFDDGDGNALYVGGGFMTAGGLTANNIARWDGSTWSALPGTAAIGVQGTVLALTVWDDGLGGGSTLHVGGGMSFAGGNRCNHVARWNASGWSPLSWPTNTGIATSALQTSVVHDDGSGPALYFGGSFQHAGGLIANRVVRWDGTNWSPLTGPSATGVVGTNNNGTIEAMASFDDGSGPALYVGGSLFTTAGGVTVNRVAKWDGDEWSALAGRGGVGVEATVWSMAVYDDGTGPALYVGGQFTTAGGATVNRIAKWDGSSWSPLTGSGGTGVGGGVGTVAIYAMTVFDDGSGPALFVGGRFIEAGGVTVNNIAKWDGTNWSALVTPDGVGIESLSGSNDVRAMTVYDDGSGPALYVGGFFSSAGGAVVNRIARWDGTAWSTLESGGQVGTGGSTPVVFALHVFDDGNGPALYAGGGFLTAGGLSTNRVARWDGTAWSALVGANGEGVAPGTASGIGSPHVSTIATFDDGSGDGASLILGGLFKQAGDVMSLYTAQWIPCAGSVPAIPGDVNGDGVVDGADLGLLLNSWGPCPDPSDCPGDINGDGVVDGADLGLMLSNWG